MEKAPKPPIKITETYYAVRRGNKRFKAFDIGPLRQNGQGVDSEIHVSARYEWTHSSNYTEEAWTVAKVNWPSLGAQNSAFTAEFAKALNWAAKQAARLDRLHKVQAQ